MTVQVSTNKEQLHLLELVYNVAKRVGSIELILFSFIKELTKKFSYIKIGYI